MEVHYEKVKLFILMNIIKYELILHTISIELII